MQSALLHSAASNYQTVTLLNKNNQEAVIVLAFGLDVSGFRRVSQRPFAGAAALTGAEGHGGSGHVLVGRAAGGDPGATVPGTQGSAASPGAPASPAR